jgi:hypothetical protein
MAATATVNDVLDRHVGLDVECLDRIYLNGYVPNLQVGGQVVSFMTAHLGYPIPSPAIMEKIGTAFRAAVDHFAADNKIPVVRFSKRDRKVEVMRPYLARQARTGHCGVAGIGFTELSNGFATYADPAALQAICDRLGPGTIGVFCERWMTLLPLPLTEHDRAGGYWWQLSMDRRVVHSRALS